MEKQVTQPGNENKQPVKRTAAEDKSIEQARTEAGNDIDNDPDLTPQSPADDLDEGELARKDNSND